MTTIRFTDDLSAEYSDLFDFCQINAAQRTAVEQSVRKLVGNQSRYDVVANSTGVPWHFIAVIHNMESSQNFTKHLHNGDSLRERTIRVPAGRPRHGEPPFSWEESAEDSLRLKKLDQWGDWSTSGILYQLERYNGWGYRKFHPDVLSPYLWASSNHYTSGKYVADGRWSDTAVSRQIGAAVLLRRMAEQAVVDFDRPVVVARRASTGTPLVQFNASRARPEALLLQQGLNRFPGLFLMEDGKAGEKTSDALKQVVGCFLHGDPR